jgi:8-oxo-dGTP pyrophosphatase MutT (NUDIX family)
MDGERTVERSCWKTNQELGVKREDIDVDGWMKSNWKPRPNVKCCTTTEDMCNLCRVAWNDSEILCITIGRGMEIGGHGLIHWFFPGGAVDNHDKPHSD